MAGWDRKRVWTTVLSDTQASAGRWDSRHDVGQAGDVHDLYRGRCSREIAPVFLIGLGPPDHVDWLEVG